MILRSLSGLVVVAGIVLAPVLAVAYSSGAPAGFAGNLSRSDGSPQTCAVSGCHSSFELNSGTGGVTVAVPSTVGVGETVRITVAVDNTTDQVGSTPRQGFEATVRDSDGEPVGTLTPADPLRTKLASGTTDYITHTAQSVTDTSWAFDWTPDAVPAGGTARIFVAGNAANANGGTSGDYIYTTSADIAVATTSTEGPPPDAGFTVGAPRPHPAAVGTQVTFDISAQSERPLTARIVDGTGRRVREVSLRTHMGGSALQVATDDLRPGTYFLVVEGDQGRQTQPFVVVR